MTVTAIGAGMHRRCARVLVFDRQDRLLLFHGPTLVRDAGDWCYFYVGGGVEPGESLAQAGARELFEERGIGVDPEQLGAPVAWCASAQQLVTGPSFTSMDWFFVLRGVRDEISLDGLEECERSETAGFAWLGLEGLNGPGITVLPRGLPRLCATLLSAAPRSSPQRIRW